jgi:hypothetical protein
MLTAIVFVCAMSAGIDPSQCDNYNAVDVIVAAGQFASPTTCLMHGQAYAAQLRHANGSFFKIVCRRQERDARERAISPPPPQMYAPS